MREYLLGIGGTAMAHLALLLRERGHEVRGSDQGVYSPMKELLEQSGIPFASGYDPANIGDPDRVVVGNAIGRGNIELEAVLNRGLHFRSQAEVLKEEVLEGRRVAVVAGTHGKTTCTSLLAWLLQDLDPGFFVGGIPRNYSSGARLGAGDPFVVEGDEYDTAFFDKGPKFLHYRPWLVLLNAVEFDHADIYRSFEEYTVAFERLVNTIPECGRLVLFADGEAVERIRARARCPVRTFGTAGSERSPRDIRSEPDGRRSFSITGIEGRFVTTLIGDYNIRNATGCIAAAMEFGVTPERAGELLASFRGVRRRQELLIDGPGGILLYDDFAHHPTAVAETLRAFRESLPERRIWAIFEPRSWSMRKNVFQDSLPAAFDSADRVLIGPVFQRDRVHDSLDPAAVAEAITERGRPAAAFDSIDCIASEVIAGSRPGDVIIVLSNGAFGGLAEKLKTALDRQ